MPVGCADMEKAKILGYLLANKLRRFSSRQQMLSWQQKKLTKHLDWVCRHSPFYREFSGRSLADFPLMNKSTMMENFNRINTLGLDHDRLMTLALQAEQDRQFDQSQLQGVTVGLSTGTSGARGLFLASNRERLQWAGYILARLLPLPLRRQRIALLLRANSPLYQTVNGGQISFHYGDLTQPASHWLAELEAFAPTIIVGSAQALQLCAQQGSNLSPQLIVSGAEVLTPADRSFIQQRFTCPVKEVYQCTEGFLASTHADGVMRWNEDLVHIEPHWLNESKSHYSPIITDFRRRTQPVIRYLLDDVIEVGQQSGVYQSLGSIAGRCGDLLVLAGVTVLPDLIYRAIARCSASRLNYRITQTGNLCLTIESNSEHQAIEKSLHTLLQGLGVEGVNFIYRDQPQWQLAQKQRRVVNACAS